MKNNFISNGHIVVYTRENARNVNEYIRRKPSMNSPKKNEVILEESLAFFSIEETLQERAVTFTPQTFNDYLGQSVIKEKLAMFVAASKMRQEPLDHVLLFGPPGLGKTTLAQVIAAERGVALKITSGPVLERSGDLVAMLSSMEAGEILFIDEIHRMTKTVEETLYSAMEQYCIDMIIGQGAGAKSIRLPLQPFTLIGATTKTSLLSGPLQTRFGIIERLDYYDAADLAAIVKQNATYVQLAITDDAALSIGARARGTPRVVKRLFRRVRDFAQVNGYTTIEKDVVDRALSFLGIDEDGLTKLDRDVLTMLITNFDGGPVGLETLAAVTGEDKDTLEQYCEPFLLRIGFLQKVPRGRMIAPKKLPYLRRRLLGVATDEQVQLF